MKPPPIEISAAPVPLTYATPDTRGGWPFRILIISVVVLSLFAGAYFALPMLKPPRIESHVAECSSNMRQIGLAMMMYANEFGGKFPDSLHEILEKEDITAEVFVCPSTNDSRAIRPTTQATLDQFDQAGHCSYIYLGKGLTNQCDPRTVVLYEPSSNHHGGLNVLFADGHAEFFSGAMAQSFLRSIANPQTPVAK